MKKRIKRSSAEQLPLLWWAVVFCCILFANGGANAQTRVQPFSADQTSTIKGKTTTVKVYGIEKAVRVDGEKDGKKKVWITRFDRDVMWVLTPDDQTYGVFHPRFRAEYMGMRFSQEREYIFMFNLFPGFTEFSRKLQGAKVERESLGSEQVGPNNCDKFRIRVTFRGHEYTSIEWAARELGGFVVRGQDEAGGRLTEYQNIRLGPQDPSLFEIPIGYKKNLEAWVAVD